MIKSDIWINDRCTRDIMIRPYTSEQIREVELIDHDGHHTPPFKIISRGQTSYGYDLSVDPAGFQVFSAIGATEIDPKRFDKGTLIHVPLRGEPGYEQWWLLPPHTYALAVSREYITMPRSVLGICTGKSTYARCGVIINTTPLEPEWEGNLVIEISNSADLPVRVYANEGIAQLIFLDGEDCQTSYADRAGKYQAQRGVQTAKL